MNNIVVAQVTLYNKKDEMVLKENKEYKIFAKSSEEYYILDERGKYELYNIGFFKEQEEKR